MNYVRLNCDEVRRQIHTQDLKRYWVAEQAGVHKTTLRRWLSGRIARVSESHVEDLAKVLTVGSQELILLPQA